MSKALANVFSELQRELKKYYKDKKLTTFEKRVAELERLYLNLVVEERHEETYDSLCKRGVELLKPANLKDEVKLRYFLRYCDAAYYDFKDNLDPLNWLIRAFMVTTMFFYIITPQYFGFILPMIMVVPVFMGIRGMKKRSLNGLITGCALVPLALMVGTMHFKSIYNAMQLGYADYVAEMAGIYNFDIPFATGLLTTINAITFLMMCSAAVTGYIAIKHNKMFI